MSALDPMTLGGLQITPTVDAVGVTTTFVGIPGNPVGYEMITEPLAPSPL